MVWINRVVQFIGLILFFCVAPGGWARTDVSTSATGLSFEESRRRCAGHGPRGRELYYTDLRWHMTRDEMRQRFDEIYYSGKRLPHHATYDPPTDRFLLPLERGTERGTVPISLEFIRNVVMHVETAMKAEYAEFVFPGDMGHAHLFLTRERWNRIYRRYRGPLAGLYTMMLADPDMRPLYHTSEQLLMVSPDTGLPMEEAVTRFRYWHRNILASNDGSGRLDIALREPPDYNTVDFVRGRRGYGAGYLLSASHLGCFGYLDGRGVKRYFDIGLTDLRRDPDLGPLLEP